MEMDNGMPIPRGRGFTPFPFGQCQVCAAEATGNHYGANTCEGCKGFFKRSLPVFRTFRCFFGNKCDVSPETRNRCKACRFRKCVEAGMALDAVKMGRIPKAVKEQALDSGKKPSRRQKQASGQASTSTTDEIASSPGSDTGSQQSSTDTAMTTSIEEFRGAFEQSLEKQAQAQRYGGKDAAQIVKQQSGSYRFHPYNTEVSHSRQQAITSSAAASAFKAERLLSADAQNSAQEHYRSINRQQSDSVEAYQALHNGQMKQPQYCEEAVNEEAGSKRQLQSQQVLSNAWQSTSFHSHSQYNDYSTMSSLVTNSSLKEQSDQKSKRSDELMASAIRNGSNTFSHYTSNGWMLPTPFVMTSKPASHPELTVKNYKSYTLADMAITGDINENEPDMQLPSEDELKAVMANSKTAVAVLNPSLRGGNQSMPVVPSDVLVFRPTYVRDDQISFSPTRRVNGFSHPQIIQKNGLVGQFLSGIPHPGFVTIDFYKKFSADPLLKSSICEYTKCLVAKGNEEIYGEETCANDAFMNETMSTGKIPSTYVTERTPQEMRDVLKDRLITQVKRVVLLSESSILGFRSLSCDDQHSLLRACVLDVWMIHSARFLRDEKSYIIFHETKDYYSRQWMEMFLTDEFLATVFEIAAKINALELSFEELALFKSILIVRPDRPGLMDVEFITLIHNHLLDALKVTVSRRRPADSEQLLSSLLVLLKGWRILDVMQERYVHPIDLSHISQGPWKVDNQRYHSASPATSTKLSIDETQGGGSETGGLAATRLSPVALTVDSK